jgi:hypothetical protein
MPTLDPERSVNSPPDPASDSIIASDEDDEDWHPTQEEFDDDDEDDDEEDDDDNDNVFSELENEHGEAFRNLFGMIRFAIRCQQSHQS